MNNDVWIHDLDPFLWQISGNIGIRYYSLAYILGVVWGAWLVWRWARQGRAPLYPSQVQDLAVAVAVGMIAGGRLGYCIFYDPSLFIDWGGGFPWWGVLKVYNGGMASHGGAIGMAIGTTWWAWRRGHNMAAMADAVATVIPIGVFMGRIANFINGELWGRPSPVDWAVIFPDAIREDLKWRLHTGDIDPETHAGLLVRMQDLTPPEWQAFLAEYGVPRHPSQLYAAVLEGLVVLAIALIVHKRHKRPGLSAATVLMVYAVVRFVNEFWRQWDLGMDPYFGWLTQGQLLSIPFFVIGAGIGVWAWRRGPKPEAYRDPAEDPGPTQKRGAQSA